MSSEQLKIMLKELTIKELQALGKELGIKLKSGMKKEEIIEEISQKVPKEKIEKLTKEVEEMVRKKAERGKRTTSAGLQQDLLREISEIKRIIDERLPARVPSFKDFTKTLIDEYWRLGGSFVNYEKLRDAVCARMLISLQQFDIWFNDLVWASAGRLTVGESRTSEGRSVHVLMKARTPEELVWGS